MTPFLTVKEASQLTSKSPSSIRRILYPIIHDDAHPDRAQIEPSVEEVLKLRMKGENFAWRLSEKLLRREITPDSRSEKGSESTAARFHQDAQAELLAMLRRELDTKNQQITTQAELSAKQMELLSALGERLREGNFIIGALQQRLGLTDGKPASQPQKEEPKPVPTPQPKKAASVPTKPVKPKRGFFFRLFR